LRLPPSLLVVCVCVLRALTRGHQPLQRAR
jgi:hypothetical protein